MGEDARPRCIPRADRRRRHSPRSPVARVKIESRTNLLFSFEKMALRDAVKSAARRASLRAKGCTTSCMAAASSSDVSSAGCEAVAALPRKQTRVLTWPLVTVFGFIAQPEHAHVPEAQRDSRVAAREYGFDFRLRVAPVVADLREACSTSRARVRRDLRDWQAARHDRHPVVHLGTGLGRIRLGECRHHFACEAAQLRRTAGQGEEDGGDTGVSARLQAPRNSSSGVP